jgi:hypothetical protein
MNITEKNMQRDIIPFSFPDEPCVSFIRIFDVNASRLGPFSREEIKY